MKFLPLYILVVFGILPIFAQNPEVKSAGAFHKIMHDADLSSKIRLDTLSRKNLFAIGVVDSLRGEISVVNGKALVSFIKDTFVRTDTTFNHEAAMLVYAYVKNWKVVTIEQDLNNLEELALLIQRLASENGIDVTKPFPFMAKTWVKNMSFQVIDWQSGMVHTADTHTQFAHELWHSAEIVMLAGFYSENHQAKFMPYSSKMYVHTITSNPLISGHLATIDTFGKISIYFPDNSNTSKAIVEEAMKLEEY